MSSSARHDWLPRTIARERRGDALCEDLAVPADLACFAGHFPGNPILPGYLLLSWARRSARELIERELTGLKSVKFLKPVRPGQQLRLELSRSEGASVSFTFLDAAREVVCRGALRFDGEEGAA